MTDLLDFLEKCTVDGEALKLKPYQKRLWKMITEKKIKLKSRSRGASQLGHSTISVMTAGAEEKRSKKMVQPEMKKAPTLTQKPGHRRIG
jgi:hypothetical protein